MSGGHYYAYCKNKGIWISFNDERLSWYFKPIVDKDVYLLFYKRKK